MTTTQILAEQLSAIVMTSYYLAEPPRRQEDHLHDAEAKCLKIIHDFQPLNLQQVADLMHVTKPRVSNLVHALENKHLIKRDRGKDHRIVLLSTTNSGKVAVEHLRAKYMQLAEQIVTEIGESKTTLLSELLTDVCKVAANKNKAQC